MLDDTKLITLLGMNCPKYREFTKKKNVLANTQAYQQSALINSPDLKNNTWAFKNETYIII